MTSTSNPLQGLANTNALLAPIAFQRLDAKLQELQHGMFEMEILPAELCGNDDISVRTDGDFLAMPKRGLQLAFSHASRILNLSGGATTSNTASDDSSLRLRATAVILFQSPEHLTACNIRKRNLVELMRRHEDNVNAEVDSRTSSELLLGALFYELTLTKSLLSSQLPRHAKSPTLWTHRRWLFTTFLELITFLRRNISDDAVDEEPDEGFVDDEEPDEEFVDDEDTEDNVIRDDTILTEEQAIALGIDVQNVKYDISVLHNTAMARREILTAEYIFEYNNVHLAGLAHPNNYTAWDHLRRIDRMFTHNMVHVSIDTLPRPPPFSPGRYLLAPIKRDCLSNPADISRLSFLLYFLAHHATEQERSDTISELLRMATSLQWHDEPGWKVIRESIVHAFAEGVNSGWGENLHKEMCLSMEQSIDRVHTRLGLGLGEDDVETRNELNTTFMLTTTIRWVNERYQR